MLLGMRSKFFEEKEKTVETLRVSTVWRRQQDSRKQRCGLRRAVGKQMSTGLSYWIGSSPVPCFAKKQNPSEWVGWKQQGSIKLRSCCGQARSKQGFTDALHLMGSSPAANKKDSQPNG
jgi:hypothetical protein